MYHGKPTGRENRVVFLCRCGQRTEPEPWPLQQVGDRRCVVCDRSVTRFVAYEDEVEAP